MNDPMPDKTYNMANVEELKKLGWHLSPEGIEECIEDGKKSTDDIVRVALDLDLKDIGEKPKQETKNKLDQFATPRVLQIQKLRNVTAPKENEESQAAPPMFKIIFTDGSQSYPAIEKDKIQKLGVDTPPGTKVLLRGKVPQQSGFLLLNKNNCQLLGGRVEKLVESWQLKRTLAHQSRYNVGSEGGGPPPFIPFGQRSKDSVPTTNRRDNFKSLETTSKEKKAEDTEFEQQRQRTIAAITEVKGEQHNKNFGSGSMVKPNDKDVASIMDMGFTVDQATAALKQNSNNVSQAVDALLNTPTANHHDKQEQHYHDSTSSYNTRQPYQGDRIDSRYGGGGNPRNMRGGYSNRSTMDNRSDRSYDQQKTYERKQPMNTDRSGGNSERSYERSNSDKYDRNNSERADNRSEGYEGGHQGERPERGERLGREGGGRGRGRRRGEEEDDEDYRKGPSAPATLFDFLITKNPDTLKSDSRQSKDHKERDSSKSSDNSEKRGGITAGGRDTGGPPNLPPRLVRQQRQKEEEARARRGQGPGIAVPPTAIHQQRPPPPPPYAVQAQNRQQQQQQQQQQARGGGPPRQDGPPRHIQPYSDEMVEGGPPPRGGAYPNRQNHPREAGPYQGKRMYNAHMRGPVHNKQLWNEHEGGGPPPPHQRGMRGYRADGGYDQRSGYEPHPRHYNHIEQGGGPPLPPPQHMVGPPPPLHHPGSNRRGGGNNPRYNQRYDSNIAPAAPQRYDPGYNRVPPPHVPQQQLRGGDNQYSAQPPPSSSSHHYSNSRNSDQHSSSSYSNKEGSSSQVATATGIGEVPPGVQTQQVAAAEQVGDGTIIEQQDVDGAALSGDGQEVIEVPGSSQVGEGSAPLVTEQPRQATDVDTATMVMSSADVVANNGGPVEYEGQLSSQEGEYIDGGEYMTADGGELAALDAQGTVYMYTTAVPPGSAENGPGTAEYYMQQPPIQQLQQMTLSPTGVSSGGLHTYQAYAPPPQAGVTQVMLNSSGGMYTTAPPQPATMYSPTGPTIEYASTQPTQQPILNGGTKHKAMVYDPTAYLTDAAGKPGRQWKPGDYCVAKYWEDRQFYRAIVQQVDPTGAAFCIVHFPDYGNMEQVVITDIRPVPKQAWDNNTVQAGAPMGVMIAGVSQPPGAGGLAQAAVPPGILIQNPPPLSFMSPAGYHTTDQGYQGAVMLAGNQMAYAAAPTSLAGAYPTVSAPPPSTLNANSIAYAPLATAVSSTAAAQTAVYVTQQPVVTTITHHNKTA